MSRPLIFAQVRGEIDDRAQQTRSRSRPAFAQAREIRYDRTLADPRRARFAPGNRRSVSRKITSRRRLRPPAFANPYEHLTADTCHEYRLNLRCLLEQTERDVRRSSGRTLLQRLDVQVGPAERSARVSHLPNSRLRRVSAPLPYPVPGRLVIVTTASSERPKSHRADPAPSFQDAHPSEATTSL